MRALTLLVAIGASIALCLTALAGALGDTGDFTRGNVLPWEERLRVIEIMAAGALLGAAAGAWIAVRRGAASLAAVARVTCPALVLGVLPPLLEPGAWAPLDAALAIAIAVLAFERLVRASLAALADPAVRAALPAPPRVPGLAALTRLFVRVIARALAAARIALHRLASRLLSGPNTTARSRAAGFLRAHWADTWRAHRALWIVVAAAAAYAMYMSIFTLRMHDRFQTYGYDLGQYDNIFWSALHGRPLRCAPLGLIDNWSELKNHAEFSIYALLPFYALRPRADTLLILQSVILGLGAIPLFRLAARRLPPAVACVLALAYLLYPPLHGLQFYDFHFQPIAATFVLFVIDLVDARRHLATALCLALALGCREDIAVGLTVLGAFLALSGHRVRAGLAIALVSAAYFVTIRFVVMPRFGPWSFWDLYADLLPRDTPSLGGLVSTLVTNPTYVVKSLFAPDKLRYLLQVLAPLAFLPLRHVAGAVAILPGAALTILTTRYPPTLEIGFQYSAHFMPYVFSAAAVALAALWRERDAQVGPAPAIPARIFAPARRRAALAALIAGTVLTGAQWGAIPPRTSVRGGFVDVPMTAPTDADRQKHRDLLELVARHVPPSAWLAMSEAEMPHVSRLNMLSLRDTSDADFLLYGPSSHGHDVAEKAIGAGTHEVIARRPGVVLAKRMGGPH